METEIRELQNAILIIAKEIADICSKHNIKYYMTGGTMLGAVRHKGFIPWDDDFDLMMTRSEYNRFIDVCRNELNTDKFFLQTVDTEEQYCQCFLKIRLNNTRIVESATKDINIHQGVFVDIFPLDEITSNKFRGKVHKKFCSIVSAMLWIKCGYPSNGILYGVLKILSIPFSKKMLKKLQTRVITKFNGRNTGVFFNSAFPLLNYPKKWLERVREYEFEDTSFIGVEDYDEFLRTMYGDYMKLPPDSDRLAHTAYPVDLGEFRNLR